MAKNKKKRNEEKKAQKLLLEQQKKEREKKEKRYKIIEMIYPLVSFVWIELAFKISTGGNGLGYVWTSLFAIAFAFLLYVLTSLIPNKRVVRVIRGTVYALVGVWACVCFFVHDTFKVFYDLNTIFAGGADAATGFTDQIVGMVFSVRGLTHILLFMLPAVIYIAWIHKYDHVTRNEKYITRLFAGAFAAVLIFTVLMIDANGLLSHLTSEYSYQTAITEYGLGTSFVLDIIHGFTDKDVSFTVVDTTAEEEPEAEPTPIIYNDQVLDIDFAALAEEDSGTYAQLDSYVASLTPTKENEYTGLFAGKNLIMISAEAFSGAIIDEELTPTLYRLATKGINFTDYYQPASAGTTGGEYENIFGLLPTSGGSSFKLTATRNNYITMGNALDRLGYNGWAFHPNDYTYYSRNLTHNNLGYSNGFMGYGNGLENVITKQWPQSDLELVEGTIDMYIDHEPFNVYYMSVSGHNPYSSTGNAMSKKNWDRVQDLEYSDEVKAYIAANLELEDALTYLVEKLEEKGIADDTVIVLGADHFPYGLDDDASIGQLTSLNELYGFTVTNYLERDQNTLILWSGCLEDEDPIVVDSPTSSLDILPTLSNLFDVDWDSRLLPGRDVFSDAEALVFNTGYDWKTDKGTYIASSGTFTPNEGVEVDEDYVDRIRTIVKNKISYCKGVLDSDYFTHLFGERTDPTVDPIPYEFPAEEEITEDDETTDSDTMETEENDRNEEAVEE